jgi:hypothetical protein
VPDFLSTVVAKATVMLIESLANRLIQAAYTTAFAPSAATAGAFA